MKRVILFCLLVFFITASDVRAGTFPWGSWTKFAGNPVLDDPDAKCIFPESMLSDVNDPLRQPILYPHPTKGNKYWMYYDTCWRGGGRLAYSDDLIHWTPYEGNPVINNFPNEVTLFIGHMFKDGDKFYVFYDVAAGNNGKTGYVITYAYSNSPFGPWNKGGEVLRFGVPGSWDSGRVTESFITKYNGVYYLYYMGDLAEPFGREEQVAVAATGASTFPQGPWVKKGLMLPIHQDTTSWDRGLTADPSVIQAGDKFYMLYTGSAGGGLWRLGIAWANNPLGPWNRPSYPVLYPGLNGSWEDYSILRGSIHYKDGKFYLPYAGSDGSTFRGGIATSESLLSNTTPTPTSTPTTIPTPTSTAGTVVTSEFFVSTGSDDAYQQGSAVYLTGSQIKMGWYDPFVGLRLTGQGMPELKGKNIINASLRFTPSSTSNSNITQRVYLELSDNCASFTTGSNNIGLRPKTAKSTLWNIGSTNWAINTRYYSPDISTMVSEVISRPNWNGNSLCVILKNEASANYTERYIYSKESGQTPASLKITYSNTLIPTSTPIATPTPTLMPTLSPTPILSPTPTARAITTSEFFAATGNDDAYQQGSTVYLTNPQIKMGFYDPYIGFRVSGGNLPNLKGKNIAGAKLKLTSSGNTSLGISQRIFLQASDSCQVFSALANNIGLRPLTTKSTLWNIGTAAWVMNTRYTSADISGAVKEVTDRANWDGGSLCVILKNEGSANYTERYIYSKESGQTPASLEVSYY